MVIKTLNGVSFKMGGQFDFGFLEKYGKVFKVFDDQDSGNICFGVEGPRGRLFVKFAGAPTARGGVDPLTAVKNLKATVPVYEAVRHDSLIRYLGAEEIGGGFAMIFQWSEGECMGRMYPESHERIMALPAEEKLSIFQSVIDFLKYTAKAGYVAIDLYDGSVMYHRASGKTTICDIDFFRKSPAVNDMGRMWGSSRFMSPEEYELGAVLDEITNVFTIGQMGFSLFTDSCREPERWPLTFQGYQVLAKAISPEREKRYGSIQEFDQCWNRAVR